MIALRGSRVLVTGSTGFVGRHLVAHLVAAGADVMRLQRRHTDDLAGTACVVVSDLSQVSSAIELRNKRFDIVFHLAGYGVAPGERDPALLHTVNAEAGPALTEWAATAGVRTIVYAGSGSEYALNGTIEPVGETHPTLPYTPEKPSYGSSKAEGGRLIRAAAERAGIGCAHARLFNLYGPGEAAHRLLPSLHASLSRSETAKLSPGTQMRDFLHVEDACAALMALAIATRDGHRVIANVSSGVPCSVRTYCLAVAHAMGRPPALLDFGALPLRPDETMFFSGDPTLLRRLTSWSPALSLKAGILQSIRALDRY